MVHGSLSARNVDFSQLGKEPPAPTLAAALCALGTTMHKAGSAAAFRAVDFDAVLAFAAWARRSGCDRFVLVSSVGATIDARSFYLRVKGEVEAAVTDLKFPSLVILRPSLLLGSRSETRPAEALARMVMPTLNHVLVGGLARYRGISARAVAAAMVVASMAEGTDLRGSHVWEHKQIAQRASELAAL